MDLLWLVTVAAVAASCSLLALVVGLVLLGPSQYNPYQPRLIQEQAQEQPGDDGEGAQYTALKNQGKDAYGRFSKTRDTNKKLGVETTVQVVVLGDLGHSPRMQYHARSLVERGATVQLVGYQDSDILAELRQNARLTVVPLRKPPPLLLAGWLPFVVRGPLKALHQAWDLYHALAYRTDATRYMLVQNPPAIPVLLVAYLVCLQRNTRLAVDWHNYGWSILALKLGTRHPLVRVAKVYEQLLARAADIHFTVTDAMAHDLAARVPATAQPKVLHDRPAPLFTPIDHDARSKVLSRLEPTAQYASGIRQGSWRLLVSSTSWTADEDFSVLLSALVEYSSWKESVSKLPNLLVVITGKGPQKEQYLRDIAGLNQSKKLEHVIIQTAWLSMPDYAALLASADLGVCLHQSSSGLDLPMKVVDMFGAGLPVLAWNRYESFGELVKEGVNGRGFDSAARLQQLLAELLAQDDGQLQALREGALAESKRRWDDEWGPVAGAVFNLKPRP